MKRTSKPSRRRFAILLGVCAIVFTVSACEERRKAGHLERGEEYFASGQYPEAIIEFLNVLQIEEDNTHAIDRLGIAFDESGQFAAAHGYLLQSAEREPTNEEFRARLARIYLLSGQRQEAREEAQAVLEVNPGNLEALAVFADTAGTEGELYAAVLRLEDARA